MGSYSLNEQFEFTNHFLKKNNIVIIIVQNINIMQLFI